MRRREPSPHAAHAAVSRISGREDAALPAVEAIARASFEGSSFSVIEELDRPWAVVWAARPSEDLAPVAFLIAWNVADELHVLNVATAPSMRRRGFARALMDEALAYASTKHVRIVLLEVRRSNRPAIKLYRGYGFTALGVRPRYYADNDEDAIMMILALDPESGEALPGRDEIRIDG